MTESQKIKRFDKIKALLDSMDKEDQRLIVWSHLSYLIEQDSGKHLVWLMEKVGELIDTETKKLISPFQ